ncbi:MAG: hypothetical protein ACJARS_004119 [bacterium]|jgi:hypothetical protein
MDDATEAATEASTEAAADEAVLADGVMVTNEAELIAGPITSPVHVVMGVHGMTVHAAGDVIEGSGHHHIIVDGAPITEGDVVPSTETHIHFGGGQTEADVELTPGEHTLTLQFANGMHHSFGPDWSKTITVTVAPAE